MSARQGLPAMGAASMALHFSEFSAGRGVRAYNTLVELGSRWVDRDDLLGVVGSRARRCDDSRQCAPAVDAPAAARDRLSALPTGNFMGIARPRSLRRARPAPGGNRRPDRLAGKSELPVRAGRLGTGRSARGGALPGEPETLFLSLGPYSSRRPHVPFQA